MKNNSLVLIKEYEGYTLTFDLSHGCMINANQMARIFGSQIRDFLKLDNTQKLIKALVEEEIEKFQEENMLLETSNFSRENIVKTIHGGRNNGTWMHRLLAIEFAGWLDVKFKIWMLRTIENILFGSQPEQNEEYQKVFHNEPRRRELADKFKNDPDYQEWKKLERDYKSYGNNQKKNALKSIGIQFNAQLN